MPDVKHTCMHCGDWVDKFTNGTATGLPTWSEDSNDNELCDADALSFIQSFADCACAACSAHCQGAANFCSAADDD